MSRLLEIMGGQQTAKQTQTGSRLMQIMDKYEQEQRKREVDAWRKQLASVPTPAPTKTVTTAQEALEAERVRREKGEPLVPFVMKKTMPEPLSMNLADSSTTAGYLANRAISGLASAAEGYESTRKLLQPKTDIPGLPPTQMEYQRQRLTEKRQQDRAETAEAGLGKSGLVRFAGDAIEAASQQIPNTLLGLASGGMGTAGQAAANVLPRVFGSTSMMAQIIGNTYTQATQNGASHKKALQYAVASGILETAVESLFSGMPGMGKGALDGLTDSLTKKIGSRFAKMLAEKGLDMFGEGVEEFVTTMIEPLVQKATIEPDKKIDWKQTVAEALYSFLVGAATAGIMQAPGTVHQAYNINSINNQAKAAERIVNVTQDGKAWELLQQKPATKMTVDEQVAFIEAIQEDLGIRETNEQTIETKGSRIVETKKAVEQAQVLQPAEQPTAEFKPQESAVENIPTPKEKTDAGQAQEVQATPKKATTFYTGSSNPNITEFKPGGDGSTKQSGDSFGVGVYLTDNPEVAKLYAQGDKGKVYTVTTNNKLLNLNEKANPNFAKTVTEAILEAPKQYRNRMLRDLGRTEKRFTNVNEARNFFEEAEKTWQSEDGEYEGNKPEADKQGDTYIVKYVDFGSNLQSLLENSTNEQIFTAIAALNTNEASGLVTASGYDGIVFKDKGAFNAGIEGNTAVIYRNTKNIKQQPTTQPQQANTQVESKPTLPDTEQELSAMVNKMEEQQKQGIKIDLQLFGAAKTKLSKFRTNTMERTPKIDPQTKRVIESAEAFDPMLFGYTPETNEAWEAEARWNVEHFYEATKRRLENSDSIAGGVATWEFSLIAEKLRNESEKTGDRTEYIEWIQRAASVGREEGRGIQAIRMAWGLDKVDGAVMQVQKTVDEVNKDISDTDPQIKRDKRKIKNSVKKAQKDAGDGVARDIETLTPEELLAKRIQSHVKEVADAKADPIKDMVNELYRIAQESPLPDKDITKRDPMEFVAQAIKNREQYTEVFNKAKEIVEKKFKGNEDALALLDAYFNKEAIPVISKIRLNAAIKNVVRNLGTTIERIAKSGRQTKTEIFKALAGEFITKGNLEQDEAKYLVPFLVDAYDAQVKERAQTILSNMLKTKTKTKGVSFAERVKEIINMGVANEDAMNRVLSEKYNLPKLDNETIQEIMDIYDTVDSEDVKAIKEAIIKESGFTGKQAEKLKDKLGGLAIDEYRAIAMAQVMKKFADRQESSFWRKLSAIQAMGHLLNAVTPMRNVLSNAAMAQLEKVSETIASAISKSDVKAGLRYSDTAVQKAKHETKRADIDIILGIDSRRESKGKYDLYRSATFKKGALSAAEKLMSKTLRLPDVYFYELRKQDALERLTAMNGGYLTDDIRKRAEYEAAYSTFMDDSLPARMLDGLKKVGNIAGFGKRKGVLQPAEFGLGDLVIKYAKVPGNIIMRTLEYSPMGYAKALYNMYQAKVGSDNSPMVAREAALAFGRATTGTGLMAIGALMYALGLFVQRKPDEEKGEAALSRAMGLNQGQVNISALGRAITGGKTKAKDGDLLVSISFFEPFATMLVAGASVKQALDEGKTAGETLSLVAGNTAEEILDMPTMAIIQAVFQESQREGTKVWDVMAIPLIKAIPGFVPQPVRSVAKAIDPKTRSTSGKTQKERALKETMRNLPLVSTLLEPQVDPTGEQYKNLTGEPATSLINYLLNPGYATIYKNIPYKDKLRTLSQAFPDSNLWPRYYAIDSVGDKKLTDKEKTVYMEAFGQYYNKAFENKLKNINVNKLSSTKKQDLIKQLEALRSDALKKGREAVVSYRKKK